MPQPMNVEVLDERCAGVNWDGDSCSRAQQPRPVLFLANADLSRFTHISPAFEELFGRPSSFLLSRPGAWRDLVHPDDRDRLGQLLARTSRKDQCAVSFRIVRPDGEIIHARCDVAIRTDAGRGDEIVGAVEAIDDRAVGVQSLAANNLRLQTIVNNTPSVAIEAYDIDGRVIMWNVAAEQLFGWTEREAIGRTLDELILDEQSNREFVAMLRQIDRTGEPMGPMEWSFRHRHGAGGTLRSTIFPVQQHDGSRIFVCMDIDITDRKSTEAALSATEQLNQQIIEAIPGGVVHVSAEGHIYKANRGAVDMLGLAYDDLTKRYVQDFAGETFNEDGTPCSIEDYPVTICLRTGRPAGPRTVGVRRPDGAMSWAVFNAIPVIDHTSRRAHGAVVTFVDITERKQFEQRQALFIREMDHRIRNNLSSLLTLIDMSRRKATDVDAFATSISGRVKAIAAVHSLIGDAHRRTLRNIIHAITPGDHIGKVQARGEHVSIPPRQITPLAMVLHELMTNSLKHGALRAPAGVIRIDWIVRRDEEDAMQVHMSWRESGGPGIVDQPSEGVGAQLMRGLIKAELRGSLEQFYPRDGAWHRIIITLDASEPEVAVLADHAGQHTSLAGSS
jgi:PAS domain S-box-containing protein